MCTTLGLRHVQLILYVMDNHDLVWKCKGTRRNPDKVRCSLCLGDDEIEHALLYHLESRNWRNKFLNERRLNMNAGKYSNATKRSDKKCSQIFKQSEFKKF
jgi:hypothetical protein